MVPRPNHLRIVAPAREKISDGPPPACGDLALLGSLFCVNAVPLAGHALGLGRWSAGALGFSAACVAVCGRELAVELRALLRRREGSS